MTGKIKLTYLLCLILTVLSCSDDDGDPTPSNPLGPCKLSEASYGYVDFLGEEKLSYKHVFEWNGDQIEKFDILDERKEDGYAQTYYTDGRLTKLEQFEGDELASTTVYEYNENGQWTEIMKTDAAGRTTRVTATYEGGLRTKIESVYQTNTIKETMVGTYTFSDGNLVKMVYTYTDASLDGSYSSTSSSTSTYEYSDMENKAGFVLEMVNTIQGVAVTPNKNYEIKRNIVRDDGSTTVVTTGYTFNDQGYPTKVTKTYTSNGNVGEVQLESYVWACE